MSTSMPEGIRLQKMKSEIVLQERVVQTVASSLDAPIYYRSGQSTRGFRFMDPGWKHFCLLKAVRAVSGLNACVRLFGGGFSQEIVVLIRTIVECTTYIEFVLTGLVGDELAPEQRKYVEAYFADFERNAPEDFGRPHVRQGRVHKVIGAHTDEMVRQTDPKGAFAGVDSAKLMSNVYLTHSNYVHGRYPEVMDLFGGDPPHFHPCGMRGTPKDLENLDILEAYVVAVSNALRFMVMKMKLKPTILRDPKLAAWYPPKAA